MSQIANFDLIILFFILGAFASWIRSDLAVPESISKFLSIFLLLSLGLKGGHEVRFAEELSGFLPSLSLGLASCLLLPVVIFFTFKKHLGVPNAAALSASYGSVSAVTFITAQSILENEGITSSGYLVAIMALMEVPAIILGVFLYEKFRKSNSVANRSILKSILSTKSFVLLLGGFIIGFLLNEVSWNSISPVMQGAFKGVLAFFLLDLGVVAQKQLREALKFKKYILFVAVCLPLLFGSLTLLVSKLLGLSHGDQIIMAVLAGSASYIAAPATMRSSVPDANPSLYLALPLAITFPMNLLIGIPLYLAITHWLAN
jgi:hypothetical protein